jgi:tRNA-splicing endonuclease subunit Sen34
VYPGDPLRFHAHFLGSPRFRDEEIPLLDLIGTGRLATAVKKGFLFGTCGYFGLEFLPILDKRTFCIEWAGM